MKREREPVSSVALQQLLEKFQALSIVVSEEIPKVLKANVNVPHRFAKAGKITKTDARLSCQHR